MKQIARADDTDALDPRLAELIDALARQAAREDHARATGVPGRDLRRDMRGKTQGRSGGAVAAALRGS